MWMRNVPDRVFSSLSDEAQLYIKLEASNSIEEKLIHYIVYAASLLSKESLLETNQPHANLKNIMMEIDSLLDLGTMHKDSLSKALFHATTSPELVKLLLMKGANPDFQNEHGNTPLHHAASMWFSFYKKNLLLSIELMASFGADSSIKNNYGQHALELINNMLGLSSHENMIQFRTDFKQILENPRPPNAIKTSLTERSSAPFLLTENDIRDLRTKNRKFGLFSHPTSMVLSHTANAVKNESMSENEDSTHSFDFD